MTVSGSFKYERLADDPADYYEEDHFTVVVECNLTKSDGRG